MTAKVVCLPGVHDVQTVRAIVSTIDNTLMLNLRFDFCLDFSMFFEPGTDEAYVARLAQAINQVREDYLRARLHEEPADAE